MSLAQIESLYEAAVAALEAGQYDEAVRKALACKMRLAATPNLARSTSGGTERTEWANVEHLDSFIRECKRLASESVSASSGPFQQSKVNYVRAGCEAEAEE